MSKETYLIRYLAIYDAILHKHNCTKQDLLLSIDNKFESLGLDIEQKGKSDRTLSRDISDMKKILGIDLQYNASKHCYQLAESAATDKGYNAMMEDYRIFLLSKFDKSYLQHIYKEDRVYTGSEHLTSIVRAIKRNRYLDFNYHKFDTGEEKRRLVYPFMLKEYKQRWYVLAEDTKDFRLKSFGLDRMDALTETTGKGATPRHQLDYVKEHFNHCFGITKPATGNPVDVVIRLAPTTGNYIKSLPLHKSQQILQDDADCCTIQLHLYITHDFIMELLSHGPSLRVLSPIHLALTLQDNYQAALTQYERVGE